MIFRNQIIFQTKKINLFFDDVFEDMREILFKDAAVRKQKRKSKKNCLSVI